MKTIYTLIDPRNNQPFYIGQTNSLETRLYTHITYNRGVTKHCLTGMRINEMLIQGVKPLIEEVETVPAIEVLYWEKYWIDQFVQWGFILTNMDRRATKTFYHHKQSA